MASSILPDRAYLCERFTYEADTGRLVWNLRAAAHFIGAKRAGKDRNPEWVAASWNATWGGKEAGAIMHPNPNCFYRGVRLDKRLLLVHRVIWKMQTGEEPPEIDHRDGNGLNNAWNNLRAATRSQNAGNTVSRKGRAKGITRNGKNGWLAQIKVSGRWTYLGTFRTAEEAAAAYRAAAEEHFGEFALHLSRHGRTAG